MTKEKVGKWGILISLVGLTVLWLGIVAVSWVEAAEEKDEYSFKWLDPDKKIYVLQNRRYLKAERLMMSGMVGVGSTNAYRSTVGIDPRIAYYAREWLGFEVFYSFIVNQENSTFDALRTASPNALPTVREIRNQMGLMAHYVPWYAKINVFNSILYFDWYLSAGAGTVKTALDTRTSINQTSSFVNEDLFAFYLGTGHQYHLNESLTVRFDYTATFYKAPIFGTTGETAYFSHSQFGVGAGFRL